jgi:hypothetical protein
MRKLSIALTAAGLFGGNTQAAVAVPKDILAGANTLNPVQTVQVYHSDGRRYCWYWDKKRYFWYVDHCVENRRIERGKRRIERKGLRIEDQLELRVVDEVVEPPELWPPDVCPWIHQIVMDRHSDGRMGIVVPSFGVSGERSRRR